MSLTFHEKSIWVSLTSTILVFAYYFSQAIILLNTPETPLPALINLFLVVIVAIIIIQVFMQSLIAFIFREDADSEDDERARVITLKATQISHYILIVGVWASILSIYFELSAIMLANMILFFFVLSEVIGYIAHLIFYRRGF